MGQGMSRVYVEKYKQKNARTGGKGILLIGLDGAGKTTVCYQFLLGKHVHTVPTMGHNKETLKHEGKKYDFFDVGGSMLVRETWRLYAKAADCIIFVVDAHDRSRIPEAAESLKKLFFGEDYEAAAAKSKSVNSTAYDIPLLVLANKQDLADPMNSDEIEKALDLASLPVRSRIVIPTDAKNGENIQAALMWLTGELAK
ncbi:ADP-ribosylation factor [Porphyridium purpureum]|uniref:ADP-ribosylation factor n=1 Tax=Porphyridium purpureum TaxID=35688 RepID=A0A5J4YKF8_PORPP|nr:ADP-ribosylation factor [Porphyridium purpureum]|eukprot:POR4305..scf244_11